MSAAHVIATGAALLAGIGMCIVYLAAAMLDEATKDHREDE